MLINTLKCCSKHIGYSVFDFNLYSCGGSQRRWYNNKRPSCCTDVPQTCNRTVVEEWPKSDPPPPPQWRPNCPQEMPANNDPYRIKVPEVVVPPMVAGNVKYMGDVLTHTDRRDPEGLKDWGAEAPNQNQQMDQENQDSSPQAEEEDGSFLSKLKKFFRGPRSKDEFTEPECNSPYQYNTRIKDDNKSNEEQFTKASLNFAHPWYKNVVLNPICEDHEKNFPNNDSQTVMVLPKLGYHGRSKYKYAFHEPWNPLDRLSLMAQAEKDEEGHCKELAAVEQAQKDPCV